MRTGIKYVKISRSDICHTALEDPHPPKDRLKLAVVIEMGVMLEE